MKIIQIPPLNAYCISELHTFNFGDIIIAPSNAGRSYKNNTQVVKKRNLTLKVREVTVWDTDIYPCARDYVSTCHCVPVLYCIACVSTHWVLSSSSAATAETKGTKRLWWSSSRTVGRTASYRSLQMSPKMCAADAEMGWRRRARAEGERVKKGNAQIDWLHFNTF